MNEWSHLPNAALIDRILADLRARPEAWAQAYYAAYYMARDEAWNPSWNPSWDATWDKILVTGREAAWRAAEGAAEGAARGVLDVAVWAARYVILALIAYDDAAQYLKMPLDHLRVWRHLSERPACILLLPAVIAFEKETV